MYWLLEMTSARPRATCSPASVTMNGSSRKRVEIDALHGAEGRAAGDDEQDRRNQSPAGGRHDRRGQHARQAEQRADREIDPGGDDDERHADGDDPGLRHRAHDIGHVVGREKEDEAVPARREDDAADRHQDEADHALEADRDGEEIEPAARGRAAAALRSRRADWLIHRLRPRFARPLAGRHARPRRREIPRPCGRCRSTTTRSQRPSSSGISLDATRTPMPFRGELANAGVDLALRADVDAARRLVEQQEARVRRALPWRARPSADCRRRARRPRISGRGGRTSKSVIASRASVALARLAT